MAMSKRTVEILLWTFFNLFLLAAILFVLDYYEIWSVRGYYKDVLEKEFSKVTSVLEDEDDVVVDDRGLALKEAELEKLNNNLREKEGVMELRERSLKDLQEQVDDIMVQLRVKWDQLDEREDRLLKLKEKSDDKDEQVKEQANKIENMPPAQAVMILEGLPPLEVIDIFRQMDMNAQEEGRISIVSYLISLISAPGEGEVGGLEGGRGNPIKAQEILRLMGKYRFKRGEEGLGS